MQWQKCCPIFQKITRDVVLRNICKNPVCCFEVNFAFVSGHEHQPSPTSITIVRPPLRSDMVTTKTFKLLCEKAKEQMAMILQCHGVPGSGKSQIIRKLAEEFPFKSHGNEADDNNILIKWHIQCKDSGHDLQEKLKELAKTLLNKSYIEKQDDCQNIVDNLEENDTKPLVDIFVKVNVPVLILVEDPPDTRMTLLKNLCLNLSIHTKIHKSLFQKVHLYVSSRKHIFLLEDKLNRPYYRLQKIEGFNEQEALDYLSLEKTENTIDDKLAVFQFFSGLPLGLNAAKAFCKKARINYKQYLELVKDVDYDIINKEKQAVMKEYGRSAQHIFQAIVVPFMPRDKNDKAAVLRWKVLNCLSYFHYDRIPSYVLKQCCHLLRESKVKNPVLKNEVEVGTLISELLDHNMCTETDEHEITFHKVVLNAFRLNRLNVVEDNFNALKKSTEIMCSLVSKDLRKKEDSLKMFKLRRHLQTLLDHVENNQQIFDDKIDELLLRALASYMHETTAAIMLGKSPSLYWNECEEHFEKALNVMFPREICKYSKLSNDDQSVEQIANKIVKVLEIEKSLPSEDFPVKYASKLKLCFEDQRDELEFLRSQSKNSQCFAELEKQLSEKAPTEIIIKKLQNCDLFLSNEKYRSVFYAERFASILYSWSRLVLYGDPDDVKKISKRCSWMSSLSHEISIKCRTSYGVALLAEHLSIRGGCIPIFLKIKESPEVLNDALSICEEYLRNEEIPNVFENGFLREVYGPSTNNTRITLLRHIVRINARILDKESSEFVKLADQRCQELFELSEKHVKTIRICIMCFIYCAKYYAAKKDFNQAMKCFEKFFELESSCDLTFHVRCWAVYNYARAVIEFENCSPESIKSAFNKCTNVLSKRVELKKNVKDAAKKSKMNKDLENHLNDCKNILDQKLQEIDDIEGQN